MRAATFLGPLVLSASIAGPGCAPHRPSARLAPLPSAPRFAVLSRDEGRTEISLLDARGDALMWAVEGGTTDVWLDATDRWDGVAGADGIGLEAQLPPSGSGGPWLSVLPSPVFDTLVRLPFPAMPGGTIAPLEFSATAAVGADPGTTGAAVRDLAVRAGRPGTLRTAYLLRGAGRTPSGGALEAGVVVASLDAADPAGGTLVATIPLPDPALASSYTPQRLALVDFAGCETATSAPVCEGLAGCAWDGASCGGDRRDGDRLIVGLASFAGVAAPGAPPMDAGPGLVAILDADANTPVGVVEIPTLRGCGEVALAPSARARPEARDEGLEVARLVVACAGAGADAASVQASAGFAVLRVTRPTASADAAPEVSVDGVWSAAGEPGLRPSRGLVALPGLGAVSVADGDAAEGTPDVAFLVDLDASPPRTVRLARASRLEETTTSGLGVGAFDPSSSLLVLPAGRSGPAGQATLVRRRIRTAELANGAFETVVCPSEDPACVPSEDAPLADDLRLENRLTPRAVARLGTP